MELSDLRRDFGKYSLRDTKLPVLPISLFKVWLDEAKAHGMDDFNAMLVSTIGKQGKPSSRVVLLKEIAESGGLVFYTNYRSRKGRDLSQNPFAAFHFFWSPLERQLRIEGKVEKVSAKKSDDYFYSRPLESQLSAIVSAQGEIIKNLSELDEKRKEQLKNLKNIKRPEYWGGYELKAEMFEFWQGGKHRMHDRIRYRVEDDSWKIDRLAP